MKFYKNTPYEKGASDCFDAVNKALTEIGINTPMTLIGAMATVRTEVGKAFLPIAEISDGSAYEKRLDLGNYRPGDGVKYKGRGLIQLTGYNNYKAYGDKFGIDLVCHPELALQLDVSAKILAQYFKDRNIGHCCDMKDWTMVRRLVNGGSNGLSTFLGVVTDYLNA